MLMLYQLWVDVCTPIHIRKLILEEFGDVALLGHNLLSGFFFFFFQPDSGEESGLCITLHISYTYLCFEQVRNTKL